MTIEYYQRPETKGWKLKMRTISDSEDAVYYIAKLLGSLTTSDFYVATSTRTEDSDFFNYRTRWVGDPLQATRERQLVKWNTDDMLLLADDVKDIKPFKPLVYPVGWRTKLDYHSTILTVEPPAACVRMSNGEEELSVAVGGLEPRRKNLLYAGILLYHAFIRRLEPHHIGTRFTTLEEYQSAVGQLGRPIKCDASDHLRTYYLIRISPKVLGEFQYFPDNPKLQTTARHIDFKTRAPVNFLRFMAGLYGQKPVIWGNHLKDPTGVFWLNTPIEDFGIMARSNSWDPRKSKDSI